MRRLAYFFSRAWSNLRARPGPTAVAVATIALAFAVLAGYLLVLQTVRRAADLVGSRLEVSAYLDDAPGEAAGRALAERVSGWAGVARVTYVSKADALARFRQALAGQAALLEALPGNPLPASIDLALAPESRSADGIAAIAASLRRLPGVTDVEYGRREAERLAALLGVVRAAGVGVALLLGLVATFQVASTVRLALYARRDEIEILRLVGATERVVRAPFLIEGALQGLAGASLALGAAALLHHLLVPSLLSVGALVRPEMAPFLSLGISAGLLVSGALVGLCGSWLSLGRRGAR